ncbi:ninjurin-2 isoform X4 [Epargyreus clarus]|uniref:ninjurin-2 isoform X4 n=1 Tax=Epargyreus clarus TaxID=520877 RepID=UPI003C30C848
MAENNNGGKLAGASEVKEINIDDLISKKEEETPTEVFGGEIKGLDANRYATKKTVAQGMLDIALLTSNASQLKYVLQVGPKHEFYTLLVTLISISMVLQVISTVVAMILCIILDINNVHHQRGAEILNNTTLVFKSVSIPVNILITVFTVQNIDNIPI